MEDSFRIDEAMSYVCVKCGLPVDYEDVDDTILYSIGVVVCDVCAHRKKL